MEIQTRLPARLPPPPVVFTSRCDSLPLTPGMKQDQYELHEHEPMFSTRWDIALLD